MLTHLLNHNFGIALFYTLLKVYVMLLNLGNASFTSNIF